MAKEIWRLQISEYINTIFRCLNQDDSSKGRDTKMKDSGFLETHQLLYLLKIVQNTANLGEYVVNDYIHPKRDKKSIFTELQTQIEVLTLYTYILILP